MVSDIAQRLEEYRQANDLTNAQLAAQLEVPETYLYRWRRKGCINGIYAKYIMMFLERRELVTK